MDQIKTSVDEIEYLHELNKELIAVLKESLVILQIYYKPNSDGSTPTITRIKQMLKKAERPI